MPTPSLSPRLSIADAAPYLVFVGAYCVFHTIINHNIQTDIQAHHYQIFLINQGKEALPVNFLFYWIIARLSGGSTDGNVLYYVVMAVLSGCIAFKYVVSRRIITGLVQASGAPGALQLLPGGADGLAALLLVIFVLPGVDFFATSYYYLFRVVPTVWHNSTIIALMPLALLLYWEQYRALEIVHRPRVGILLLLVVLNVAVKPSFFFVYAVATPVLVLLRVRQFNWRLVGYLLPTAVGLLLIAGQSVLLYRYNYGSFQQAESKLIIHPFTTWHWDPYSSPYNLIISFILPLAAVGLLGARLPRQPLVYPALLAAVAVAIYASVAEAGPRATHLNFTWQNIPATYILLLVTIVQVAIAATRATAADVRRYRALSYLTLLHFLSGAYYLFRLLMTTTYF